VRELPSLEALAGSGRAGISALTSAVHSRHAEVIDPTNGLALDATANRSACYRCHPGSETKCLRGAMGAAVAGDGSLAMHARAVTAGCRPSAPRRARLAGRADVRKLPHGNGRDETAARSATRPR